MEKVTDKQHGLLEQLRDRLNPAIEDLGYELYDLEDLQSQGQRILRVSIDHEQGIQLEDCVRIDQKLQKLLDENDPIEEAYTLEVSSPGIDRPLTRLTDFEAWNGYEAKIETIEAIDGQKRFKGILAGINNEEVLITINIGTIGLDFNWISDAKLILTDDLITETLNQQNKFNENDFDEIEQEVLN